MIRVVQPGLYTLLVDYGRPRSRSLGVPVGGAADRTSLALANALVGNPPDAPALEINLAGPVLRAECELACVIAGAPFALHSERQRLTAGTTFTLEAREELHIGTTEVGARAYFCVHGGIQAPLILESHSAFDPVSSGAELACPPGRTNPRFIRTEPTWGQQPLLLRVLDGPQADWLVPDDFYAQEFKVSPSSNRMGVRLNGQPLRVPARELVSEPVSPGAVQVTRDGQCIVLGVDGQTIGGYPKVAHVITADLDALGQLRPGGRVRFARVTCEEAEALYHKRQTELSEWVRRLRTSWGGAL